MEHKTQGGRRGSISDPPLELATTINMARNISMRLLQANMLHHDGRAGMKCVGGQQAAAYRCKLASLAGTVASRRMPVQRADV